MAGFADSAANLQLNTRGNCSAAETLLRVRIVEDEFGEIGGDDQRAWQFSSASFAGSPPTRLPIAP
jgi:hypothetical protein